jgi:hypothetical protein
MRKLVKSMKETAVSFCERCGEICAARRRRSARREQSLLRQVWLGVRV